MAKLGDSQTDSGQRIPPPLDTSEWQPHHLKSEAFVNQPSQRKQEKQPMHAARKVAAAIVAGLATATSLVGAAGSASAEETAPAKPITTGSAVKW